MRINVIYDDRRSDDYERLLGEFMRQGITKYKFWNAVVDKNSVVASINASHKMIIQWAKDNNKEYVCIAEQDLSFPAKDGWQHFLKNKPDSFDIYIGGTYFVDGPQYWKPPVIKVKDYVGNHLIIVSKKYYDTFLSVPDDAHIDMAQGGLGDFYVCFPFAAIQRAGFSFNCMVDVNYNASLRKEWIYQ
jgi:hypothetical protein